jgi:hypothetical protein
LVEPGNQKMEIEKEFEMEKAERAHRGDGNGR